MCFFFLFIVLFKSLFRITVVKERTRVKPSLAIPTKSPITIEKEMIDILPIVADKTIKLFSKQSKAAIYLLSFLLIIFLSSISE